MCMESVVDLRRLTAVLFVLGITGLRRGQMEVIARPAPADYIVTRFGEPQEAGNTKDQLRKGRVGPYVE